MGAMIALEGPEVEFTFFRGTQDELKDLVGASVSPCQKRADSPRAWLPPVPLSGPSHSAAGQSVADGTGGKVGAERPRAVARGVLLIPPRCGRARYGFPRG